MHYHLVSDFGTCSTILHALLQPHVTRLNTFPPEVEDELRQSISNAFIVVVV